VKKAVRHIEKKIGSGTSVCVASCTGISWREKKPVWDRSRCFKCGLCWLSCPDAAVRLVDEGFYDSDPERCKGCGICAGVCWNDAITMVPEQSGA
jgi:2-oxoacid:acceptor oxidoreductase delta subunit (pyruvate/2-ketoisovalerate family)